MRGLAGVAHQDFRPGDVDQCAGQTGLDVVERLVNRFRLPVDDVPLSRALDELHQRLERLGRKHRVAADVRVIGAGFVIDLEKRRQRDHRGGCFLVVDPRIPRRWLLQRPCSSCTSAPVRAAALAKHADKFRGPDAQQ